MINKTDHTPIIAARLCIGIAAFCLCIGSPIMARAQVLEIDDAGAITVHDRPEVTSDKGSTAIIRPALKSLAHPTSVALDRSDLSNAARIANLSPDLVEAVAWRESHVRPRLVSPAGAIGEMQLMPGAARDLGVDPYDSKQNLRGGAMYLAGLLKRYDGDVVRALAAYNAGPHAVDRYGGVPPYKETQAYVAAILDRLSQRAAAPER